MSTHAMNTMGWPSLIVHVTKLLLNYQRVGDTKWNFHLLFLSNLTKNLVKRDLYIGRNICFCLTKWHKCLHILLLLNVPKIKFSTKPPPHIWTGKYTTEYWVYNLCTENVCFNYAQVISKKTQFYQKYLIWLQID